MFSAPLQGFTDAAFRAAHQAVCGGVSLYYAPFLRLEHGEVRAKDLRDITPVDDFNAKSPCRPATEQMSFHSDVSVCRPATGPQVIASGRDEFLRLVEAVLALGYKEVDLNMGCPFPMQVHKGRGAGLLQHPSEVEAIVREMQSLKDEVRFSVKMRLGWESTSDAMILMPILNDAPLVHLTLHPRLGVQQYKGNVDTDAFADIAAICKHPLVWNGDICTLADYVALRERFPSLYAVMIGRGLLCRPTLAQEIRTGVACSEDEVRTAVLKIHNEMLSFYRCHMLCPDDAHLLQRLLPMWEYAGTYFSHKSVKALKKSRSLQQYLTLVHDL